MIQAPRMKSCWYEFLAAATVTGDESRPCTIARSHMSGSMEHSGHNSIIERFKRRAVCLRLCQHPTPISVTPRDLGYIGCSQSWMSTSVWWIRGTVV
jgi:hypothetical protein